MSIIYKIKIFNDILDHFLNYLSSNFPLYKSDIMLSKSTIEFIRKNNPRLIVEQFMMYSNPYKKQILQCNEKFFLDVKLEDELSEDKLLIGSKIRNIWMSNNITDIQKAHIWGYFHKLLKTGQEIVF